MTKSEIFLLVNYVADYQQWYAHYVFSLAYQRKLHMWIDRFVAWGGKLPLTTITVKKA